MKKLMILTAALPILLIGTLLVSSCGTILVTKNGDTETGVTETRQYDFTDFSRVAIGSAFDYEIKQSDVYNISITASSNLFDDIDVLKMGQTLMIGMDFPKAPWAVNINNLPGPKAIVTMPQLQGLAGSGASHGSVTGYSSTEVLDVTASGASTVALGEIAASHISFGVSGASKVTGDITTEYIELGVSGASTVHLKGTTSDMYANATGASHLELADLKTENANIVLSGASNGTVNLDGRLDAELSGASTLEYLGEPSLGTMIMTGASKLDRK